MINELAQFVQGVVPDLVLFRIPANVSLINLLPGSSHSLSPPCVAL